ncbi:hypothetical protein [Acetobacter sp. KSO5]|uniref:hypothetical protein n=1 Tax=Acetobacter sp. KSO5 TaxID=3373674 RepID=UPI00376F45D3
MNELTISCLSIHFTCPVNRQVAFPLLPLRLYSLSLLEGTGIDVTEQWFCFSDLRPLPGYQGKDGHGTA